MSEDFISFKCSVCNEIVGYAPLSVIRFMKKGGFLKTYKCTKCKEEEDLKEGESWINKQARIVELMKKAGL